MDGEGWGEEGGKCGEGCGGGGVMGVVGDWEVGVRGVGEEDGGV